MTNVGIAAMKGSYAGKLKLEDKRPPEHYKMIVDAKGKQGCVRGAGDDARAVFAAAEAELKAQSQGKVARQDILINFWRYLMRLLSGRVTRP